MERHGYRSVVADRMREDYRARVQARLDRVERPELPSVAAPVVPEPKGRETTIAAPTTSRPKDRESAAAEPMAPLAAPKRQSLEDIRREARENWLRLRQSQRQGLAESAPSPAAEKDRSRDDDITR